MFLNDTIPRYSDGHIASEAVSASWASVAEPIESRIDGRLKLLKLLVEASL